MTRRIAGGDFTQRIAISAKNENINGVPKFIKGRTNFLRNLIDQKPLTNRPLTKQCIIPMEMVTHATASTTSTNSPPISRTTGTNAICNTLPSVLIPLYSPIRRRTNSAVFQTPDRIWPTKMSPATRSASTVCRLKMTNDGAQVTQRRSVDCLGSGRHGGPHPTGGFPA